MNVSLLNGYIHLEAKSNTKLENKIKIALENEFRIARENRMITDIGPQSLIVRSLSASMDTMAEALVKVLFSYGSDIGILEHSLPPDRKRKFKIVLRSAIQDLICYPDDQEIITELCVNNLGYILNK